MKEEEALKLLLSTCKEVTWADEYQNSVLHRAVLMNHNRILEVLLDYAETVSYKWVNGLGETPLHIAAKQNSLAAARILLNHGVDINQRDKVGSTALTEALVHQHYKMVELLLKREADRSIATEFCFGLEDGYLCSVPSGWDRELPGGLRLLAELLPPA